jgi:hypothetical protein
MKKILLLLTAFGVIGANAQSYNIPTTHKTLVLKFTADWCGPCGEWGWVNMEQLITDSKNGTTNCIPVAVHNNSSNQAVLQLGSGYGSFFNGILDVAYTGIPSFAVGGHNMNQVYASSVESQVSSVTSSAAEVNIGFAPKWTSATAVTVDTRTQFFSTATGNYSVGVYMYEDNIMAQQYQPDSPGGSGGYRSQSHMHILRQPSSSGVSGMGSGNGQTISGTSFTSSSSFDNTFNLTIPSMDNKANITLFAVVWKKNGSKWDVANVNNISSWPAGVNNVNNAEVIQGIYPNPASNKFMVALGKSITQCTMDLYDVTGKKVAELYNGEVSSTAVGIAIDRPSGLPNGIYLLNINSNAGSQTMKITLQ